MSVTKTVTCNKINCRNCHMQQLKQQIDLKQEQNDEEKMPKLKQKKNIRLLSMMMMMTMMMMVQITLTTWVRLAP